jgi:hypothetical protein
VTFWHVMPCSLVNIYQDLRRTCCLHLQGTSTLSYGITSQKIIILMFTTMRTSNIIHRYIKSVKSFFSNIHNVLHSTLSFYLKHVSNDELYLKLTYLQLFLRFINHIHIRYSIINMCFTLIFSLQHVSND